MLRAPSAETRECAERAIEIARAVGALAIEGHALNSLGWAKFATGDWAGAEQSLREAMGIAGELHAFDDAGRAYTNLSECLDQQGRLDEGAALALEGARFAEQVGVRSYSQFLQGEASWRLARLGRLDEAQATVERGLAAAPKGMSAVVLHEGAAHVALRRGRLDDAVEHFHRARELLSGTTDSRWVGNAVSGQAEVALWRSDPEGAWQLASGALDALAGREYVHSTARLFAVALRAAADCALRATSLGDEPRAEQARRDADTVLERFRALLAPERWHDGAPGPEPAAFEAQCAAELSRADARPDPGAWDAAAQCFAALGLPFELSYARWRQAEALIAGAGNRGAAAHALGEAADLAAGLPAPLLAAEIESLGRRARVPVGAPGGDTRDDAGVERWGLTEREHAVLALLADGRTNRQIGQTLFISEKTASVHVSRILGKLGVRSRVEAATTAHRLGLV
jgi:ATP/maltotriose-dependent transcriptional regulator MalT